MRGGGELRGLANENSCPTGAQVNFGDLTPYLTFARIETKTVATLTFFAVRRSNRLDIVSQKQKNQVSHLTGLH